MFKLKSSIISILFCGIALAANANTAPSDTGMNPPKPLDNKVYDAMVGTWKGDSNMMGKKMHDVLKVRWGLNHQFLIVEVNAVGVEGFQRKYEGMGIFGVDAQGKAKTFWFDSWGADAVSTGSGTFGDNKLEITDSNPMFKETRNFEIKGKEMIMHAKGTSSWQGKETPFDVTTVYKRK